MRRFEITDGRKRQRLVIEAKAAQPPCFDHLVKGHESLVHSAQADKGPTPGQAINKGADHMTGLVGIKDFRPVAPDSRVSGKDHVAKLAFDPGASCGLGLVHCTHRIAHADARCDQVLDQRRIAWIST